MGQKSNCEKNCNSTLVLTAPYYPGGYPLGVTCNLTPGYVYDQLARYMYQNLSLAMLNLILNQKAKLIYILTK